METIATEVISTMEHRYTHCSLLGMTNLVPKNQGQRLSERFSTLGWFVSSWKLCLGQGLDARLLFHSESFTPE